MAAIPSNASRKSRIPSRIRSGQRVEPELQQETPMPRKAGDRYVCEKCGATLVYEKPCPCPEGMPHSEICCGQQMKLVDKGQAAGKAR